MAKKAPRRTAERILEAALDLFNRFGEPNVSTTLVAGELGISEITVKAHRGRVMRKMQATSLADLVNLAAMLGLAASRAH